MPPILLLSITEERVMAESELTYQRLRQIAIDGLTVLALILLLAVEFSV
jgi:hypothetical protein